ncbi:MAG: hypothetical protein AAB794_03690 [Patescibacteria group bacterium]
MALLLRKIIAPLTLVSFFMVAFFGFAAMTTGQDGRMQGDCPFSAAGAASCPQDALGAALHHLSSYQSFLSVPMNPSTTAFIIALLTIVSIALVFSFHPLLYGPHVLISYIAPTSTSHDRKIKRWLSLLEHSPSR